MNKVDIIIPTFNEERFIRACLESVLDFERDANTDVAIHVVDGRSADKTREIVLEIAAAFPEVRLLDNPNRIQSSALNVALHCSDGNYVLRLDAHAKYPRNYLRCCLTVAIETKAANVGGVVITQPGSNGYQAKLVQAISTHWFGVGNSGFRIGARAGPVDTVPFGFFPRTIFEKIGYFDERLVRAQDYEFNRRIIAGGGTVWLDPRIEVFYYNMSNLWPFYGKQITREGCYNAYLWYLAPYARAPRHAITGVFVCGVIFGYLGSMLTPCIAVPFVSVMVLYALLAIYASFQQCHRYRDPRLLLPLPFCFLLFHISHGLGVLVGCTRLVIGNAPVQKIREPWPQARRFRAWPDSRTVAKNRSCPPNGADVCSDRHRDGFFCYQNHGKRLFDFVFACGGLVLLGIPMLLVGFVLLLIDGWPPLFLQERVGRGGSLFTVYKFRTMRHRPEAGSSVTLAGDLRVSGLGRILRRFKIDELPQLINVFKGDMSFVGPRPDVPGYADQLQGEARTILLLRPGITGPATLAFRNEEQILASVADAKSYNDEVIFPEKVRLNVEYAKAFTLRGDIRLILRTILS